MTRMAGAFGDEIAFDEEDEDVRGLLTPSITAEINGIVGNGDIRIVSYRKQVVAGTNFLFNLKVGEKDAVAKIFVPLPHTKRDPELLECK